MLEPRRFVDTKMMQGSNNSLLFKASRCQLGNANVSECQLGNAQVRAAGIWKLLQAAYRSNKNNN